MTKSKAKTEALFDVDAVEGMGTGGPLYQSVCATLRALDAAGVIDQKGRHAGPAGLARHVARALDYHGGRNRTGAVASGMQLAALHGQLLDAFRWLDPAGEAAGPDAFDQWLAGLPTTGAPAPEVGP